MNIYKEIVALNGQDVYNLLKDLKSKGINLKNVIVYIGNDEELNGIHSAFCIDNINNLNKDDKEYFIDMINNDYSNIKYNEEKINILIS